MHQDESVSLDDVMCHDLNADPGPARLLWIQMCAVPDRSMSVARSRGRCAPAVACRIVCCTSYVSRRASHVVCCMSYVACLALHVVRLHVVRCARRSIGPDSPCPYSAPALRAGGREASMAIFVA